MYLVNGGSQKTSSSHSCDTVMPLSLRRRDWLAAGVRRPSKNASPILSGAGCGTARHALQKLPRSSARFGLSAVPPQAGPTRSGPAQARKQENRKYFTEVPHASCSHVFDLTTRAGGRHATHARIDQGHDSGRPGDSGNCPEDRIENDPHLPYAGDDLEHPEHAKDPQVGKHAAVRHEGSGDDAEVEDISPILTETAR